MKIPLPAAYVILFLFLISAIISAGSFSLNRRVSADFERGYSLMNSTTNNPSMLGSSMGLTTFRGEQLQLTVPEDANDTIPNIKRETLPCLPDINRDLKNLKRDLDEFKESQQAFRSEFIAFRYGNESKFAKMEEDIENMNSEVEKMSNSFDSTNRMLAQFIGTMPPTYHDKASNESSGKDIYKSDRFILMYSSFLLFVFSTGIIWILSRFSVSWRNHLSRFNARRNSATFTQQR